MPGQSLALCASVHAHRGKGASTLRRVTHALVLGAKEDRRVASHRTLRACCATTFRRPDPQDLTGAEGKAVGGRAEEKKKKEKKRKKKKKKNKTSVSRSFS